MYPPRTLVIKSDVGSSFTAERVALFVLNKKVVLTVTLISAYQ